ncbi:hypothetical protein ILUMI_04992, partial [Ignelater luminosus]
ESDEEITETSLENGTTPTKASTTAQTADFSNMAILKDVIKSFQENAKKYRLSASDTNETANARMPAPSRSSTIPSNSKSGTTNIPRVISPKVKRIQSENDYFSSLPEDIDTTTSKVTKSEIKSSPTKQTPEDKKHASFFTCNCPYELMRNSTAKEFRDIFTHFWPYEKIERYLFYIAEMHPDRVQLVELGKTYEKRSIYAVQIGMGLDYNNMVFIDAGMNARQWGSIMMALYIIHVLTECNMYESIAYIDWLIMPVVNPDGYAYSFSDPKRRMWNKNRSPCPKTTDFTKCEARHSCGVDINRNFLHMFASRYPCSDFYPGSDPISEVETNVTVQLLNKFKSQIKLYLGIHTYGAAFLYPYTSKTESPNINKKELEELAEHAVDAINSRSSDDSKYMTGNYAEVVVPEGGTSLDHAKDYEIRYAYYAHLKGHHKLKDEEILPIVSECFY